MSSRETITAKFYEIEALEGGIEKADLHRVRAATAQALGVTEDEVRSVMIDELVMTGAG